VTPAGIAGFDATAVPGAGDELEDDAEWLEHARVEAASVVTTARKGRSKVIVGKW
jgi:hypothetical protein